LESYLISIAGNIAAGKSTLTKALEKRSDGKIVSFLERVPNSTAKTRKDFSRSRRKQNTGATKFRRPISCPGFWIWVF